MTEPSAIATERMDIERPLRADARRNRERIIEAARAAFAERGAETQMDDVAQRAGVGVGTVYRHFPTKEALMAELVRQKFMLFSANAREAIDAEGEPFEVFAELLFRNCEYAARDAGVQHALTSAGEEVFAQAEPEQRELIELSRVLMERAQRAGTMRPDIGPEDLPMLMCGVSATMAWSAGRGFDWRRHLSLVIDAFRPQPAAEQGSASRPQQALTETP